MQPLDRSTASKAPDQLLRLRLVVSVGTSEPLDLGVRRRLEDGLGSDLSMVRVYTGPEADATARAVHADALTCGANIFFRDGAYTPDSADGFHLLAHEAVHVVQQRQGGLCGDLVQDELLVSDPGDRSEREAQRCSALLADGRRARVSLPPTQREVGQRSPTSDAVVVQRHVSFEHRLLGDSPTKDLVAISTGAANRASILQNQIALLWQWHQDPLSVTEAMIESLCPWIHTVRLGPSGLLVTYGELNALPDYLADPVALDTVPPNILLGILQVIRQEGYNQLSLLLNNTNPNLTFKYAACSPWQLSLINNIVETRALDEFTDRLGVNSSNHYQGLLARNACHFAPFSWYRWQASQLIARDLAQRAYAATDANEKARLTHEALVAAGYGDHFLEDSFAAGHLLNKSLVMQWFIEWAATQAALPVADWDQIKGMTTTRQPGLAGLKLYNPTYGGPSNDPQTAEEAPTFLARMLACGVVPDGLDLSTAYQYYLTWLSSAVTQLASANVHDYYNDNSLWVSSTAQSTPYEVWGDDTLLTGTNGGNGVAATSQTAQLSQQALAELLSTGKTSISVESIRGFFPTRAGTSSTNVQDLQTFNTTTLHNFCVNTSFPSVLPMLKDLLLGLASPRLGVVSQDQNLTNMWNVSLPSSGYNRVDVVTNGGRMFAGTNGYVYELDPSSGEVLHSLLVTGSIGVGDYTTHIATDGQTLFVGVHGYVYGVSLTTWKAAWNVGVGGTGKFLPASVLAQNGQLYCGSNGSVYQIDPSSGNVLHSLGLGSIFGVGDYETRLATDGVNLYAGTHGYVYGIPLNRWQSAWNVGVGGTAAYKPVSVLAQNGQLFAGSNGYAYQIDPTTGKELHSLLLTDSIGAGDYSTRLATDGQTLFVGVHGYVYGIALVGTWAASAWNVSVGGKTGLIDPVMVLATRGRLFAGANGYAYELTPSRGSIVSSVLLASPYWVGDFATELATDGRDLLAGTHGYAYKVLVQAKQTGGQPLWGLNATQAIGQNNIYQYLPAWKSVAGYLTGVGVGSDGSVWGVNAHAATGTNNIVRWTGTAWTPIPGYLTQIAVGSATEVWGVNTTQVSPANNVYRWNGSTWVSIAGYLTSVAVAADGTVWGVNATQASTANNIYRWNGSTWVSIAGYLTDIAVGPGGVAWGVNATQAASSNNIYAWNGSGWNAIAGYLTDVTAGADGTVFGVNSQQPAGTNNVYVWNGVTWDAIPGYLTQIAATSSSQFWGVNAQQANGQNNIYQSVPGWQTVAGYVTCVGVGSDGSVWGVNARQASPANNIYRWNGTGWTSVAGYLTQIAVGSASQIWGVNATQVSPANNIYSWNGTGWASVPGYLTNVAVAADGTVWGVNATQAATANNIYVWNGVTWAGVAGHLTAIGAAPDGTVWGVNATQVSPANNVYRWNGSGWDPIAGYLTDVAVAGDGTVWGVNATQVSPANNVYRWNGSMWDTIPGYLTQLSVGGPWIL